MAQPEHIEAIEKRLWSAADTLRAKIEELNPGLPATQNNTWGEPVDALHLD